MGCGTITRKAEELGITPGVNVLEDVSKNFEGAGVTVKWTPLKAGQSVIQHKHEYPHLSVLLSGIVILKSDDSQKFMDATRKPQSVVIEANKYHSLSAITDATWLCIHTDGKV